MLRSRLVTTVGHGAVAALLALLGACTTPERPPGVPWLLGATAMSMMGMPPDRPDFYESPVRVTDTLTFTAIAAGGDHTCALESGGDTYCWGSNQFEQLGSAAPAQACAANALPCSFAPVRVEGAPRFSALAASLWGTCGLDLEGRAHCWGYVAPGGAPASSSGTPVAVSSNEPFVALTSSAGGHETCGLTLGGAAWCWTAGARVPARVPTSSGFVAIAISGSHGCGIDAARDVFCWGNNQFGQLGVGSSGVGGGLGESTAPLAVRGGPKLDALAAAAGYSCGLNAEGALFCWGLSFGDDAAVSARAPDRRVLRHGTVPVAVATEGRTWSALGAGATQVCALGADGAIDCFATTPTQRAARRSQRIEGDEAFVSLTVGGQHACALGASAFAHCWGLNHLGQAGRAPTGRRVR